MSELPKAFVSSDVEKKWYTFWEQNRLFACDPNSQKPAYCIMMPPPNVTGVLHMGHALVSTLQDILIRYKRMCGFDALWLPGCDHAGIATQTVVERHLLNTTGKRRSDFSRDEFLKIVWNWKEKSEKEIIGQLKAIGSSCDWSKQRFTMDPGYCKAVRVMFKKLYNDGLIVRSDYLVNWDPVTKTALADDEVEYEEKNGFLWHFRYPLVDSKHSIEFATTRPETMLGDTAVAVNPKDERYRQFIGKMVLQPLTGRHIPIIADDHVDPEFGTGVVKITPAHDHDDYRMGIAHSLPMITIMTEDGHINASGGEFEGLSMLEARSAVSKAMQEKGFFVKQVPYINRVGVSYRSKAVIEPHLSKQWFVKMTAFKDMLRAIVQSGKTKLIPSQWNATYFHWIEHLHDWCISRQLWWGHRIPIWYNKENPDQVICHDGEDLPDAVKKNPDAWEQDPDVLDTWFSSALWPFATLGWPDDTVELKKYYPNSVLVTGHDILFFWVARMLMMGTYAKEQVPFPESFLHGLIYGKSYWRQVAGVGSVYVSADERREYDLGKELPKDVQSKWEKMSKSKGNIIDPLQIIADFGADACRMALASGTTEAPQIDLDLRRFEEFKNFANKIWNGARFVFMNLQDLSRAAFSKGLDEKLLTLEDHWILAKLQKVCMEVTKHLDSYHFDRAATESYEFYWNELCAYYLEVSKPYLFGKVGTPEVRENKQKLLVILLLQAIRLLHPMAPYITEELFHYLKQKFEGADDSACELTNEAIKALRAKACIVSPFPKPHKLVINRNAEREFELLCDIVYAIRNIRGEMKVAAATAVDVYIVGDLDNISVISSLVKTNTISCVESCPVSDASFATVGSFKIYVPLPQELKAQESARLAKEEERLKKQLEALEQKLSNTSFLEKAPQDVVQKLIANKEHTQKQLEEIRSRTYAV